MLFGNIILQQTSEGKLHEGNSWKQGLRFCDIVDGQQRVTTLVMLYAAIQQHLRKDRVALESVIDELHVRLGVKEAESTPFLTTQQDDFGQWFSFKPQGDLTETLHTFARARQGYSERANALYMLRWLEAAATAP